MTNNKVIFLSFIVLIGFATGICRVIYCGDNLDQLKKFPPKKILFIYFIMQLNY